VTTVTHSSLAPHQLPVTLNPLVSLNSAGSQISHHGDQRARSTDHRIFRHGAFRCGSVCHSQKSRPDDAAHSALHRFLGTENRRHLMFSYQHTHTVGAGIASPGAEKDQPDNKMSVLQIPGKIDIGQHYRHINRSEEHTSEL